jgi:hypothetical protein
LADPPPHFYQFLHRWWGRDSETVDREDVQKLLTVPNATPATLMERIEDHLVHLVPSTLSWAPSPIK